MSFILDILLSKSSFNKMHLTEVLVTWGEESFSQTPRKYEYKSTLIFHENTDINYYKKIWGESVNNCTVLTLEGQHLSELEYFVNSEKQEQANNVIIEFLSELYNTGVSFSILLLRDEECIDNKYIINNMNELINVFCNSLSWNSPEGVVITKNFI